MSSSNTPATGSNATAASNGSSSPPNERARADDQNKFGAKRQALATLSHLGLELGDSIVYDKERAVLGTVRNGDTQVNLSTNIFGLKTVACDIHLYHLEFLKVFTTGKYAGKSYPFIDLERKAPDFTTFQNRQNHGKLLKAFLNKYPKVFGNDHDTFCYDYAASLYSLYELVSFDTSMFLTEQETNEAIGRPYKVTLSVKKPQDNVFNVRDLTRGPSLDLSQQPRHVIRFLELVTSRHAASHPEEHVMYESKKTYYMRPENYGFNLLQLGGGKYLAAGASKTVACVEGPKKKGAAAVIIDSKKTAFFHSTNLLEMLCSAVNVKPSVVINMDQFRDCIQVVKRLEVFPTYGNRQNTPILLSGLTEGDALTTMLESNGEEICIAEYFSRRYGITLSYPHWPLAIGAKKVQGNKPSFPVELLVVADYQRVGSGNITSTDIAAIVKSCAVLPAIKNREITNCYQSFSFGVDAFMQKAGMSVLEEPLKIPARVLKAPQVKYANGSIYPEQNGKWRLPKQAKYAIAATVKRWLAVFLIVPHERMKFGEFKQFAQKFYFECGNRGLHIDEPYGLREVVCDEHAIEELFENARKERCEYILFGHSDRDTKHHSVIKGMERKYEVISQCVRTKTIYNVMTKSPLSLENIVAKANVKLGGLNYNIVLDDFPFEENVLFIGLGMNHPAGGIGNPHEDAPAHAQSVSQDSSEESTFPKNVSVLGFCANDGVAANEFIGNFFFSPPHRDEKLSVLDKLLAEVFERFQTNRQTPPSRIVLFRSGCDEGGYRSVLRYEMPVVTAICNKYAPGAPVTLIIPSKLHSFRFFKQDINPNERSDGQNIRPGTVLDEHVVNSAYSEFYLNSHLALQGTAKTPKYTILYSSEKEGKLDFFERWTNALCYDFQIVCSPTSVPAPVYIAQRYAERGRQIWNTFYTSDKANLSGNGANGLYANGSGSDGNGSSGSNGKSDPNTALVNQFFQKSIDYNFTKKLILRDKRVNA